MVSLNKRVDERFNTAINENWGGMIDAAEAKKWLDTPHPKGAYASSLDGKKPSTWSVDDFANWMLDSQLTSSGKYEKDKHSTFPSKVLKLASGFDLEGAVLDNDGFFKMKDLNKDFNKFETMKSAMYDVFNRIKQLAK